ncbi:MAG TPA: NAD(P)-dependent oxidoreductase [Ramlibacter sp.]|nr:NAD(P)-dependent oxidoreductase [Ramlibacter sp.]
MRNHKIDPARDTILITGAAGRIATGVRLGLRAAGWRHVRLTDARPVEDVGDNEEFCAADVSDRETYARLVKGASALVHLAGAGANYSLEHLFRINVRGLFDVFESARLGGVRRIVYASSNHTFGCYPITTQVTADMPVRPDSLYGAFKVYGEAVLRAYYERHDIRSVSLRIGTCFPLPIDQRSLSTWLSLPDAARLVDASLRHPDPGYLIVKGYSANSRLLHRDPNWQWLGYEPQDNAENHVDMLRAKGVDVDGPWEWKEHGGHWAHAPEPRVS